VYVNNEINSTLTVFKFDKKRGALEEVPNGLDFARRGESNSTAEIEVHPSGKFVYVSNRGHNSIAAFRIDPKTGRVALIEHQPTQGKTPRNFAIDPAGHFLLAENQDSNSIVVFRIDPITATCNRQPKRPKSARRCASNSFWRNNVSHCKSAGSKSSVACNVMHLSWACSGFLSLRISTEYRDFISELLRLCGYDLLEAQDGEGGIRLAIEGYAGLNSL